MKSFEKDLKMMQRMDISGFEEKAEWKQQRCRVYHRGQGNVRASNISSAE